MLVWLIRSLYILIQGFIILFFKPKPPKDSSKRKSFGRVAVIGAGLTGVSAAAHAIAHGFDVVVFEANESVGGVWSNVNSTSSLQLNSILYRFHPAVLWRHGFPRRDEILSQIRYVWKEYRLEDKTRFNTRVTSVRRATKEDLSVHKVQEASDRSQWVINDGSDGIFDAVIASIGTCGEPLWVEFPGMPRNLVKKDVNGNDHDSDSESEHTPEKEDDVFKGRIVHSSQLDSLEEDVLKGKTLIVVGSGASGVEAVETALEKGASKCYMLARDDKWIIPRNTLIDTLIATQPFGRQMPLSFLWEDFIKYSHYRGLKDLVPAHMGLFEGTPVVNDTFLTHIRKKKCVYVRGDTQRFTSSGAIVNVRPRESRPNDPGKKTEIKGDVIVLATGYKRPELDFFDQKEYDRLFPKRYERPDLYLQTFATGDWSVTLPNAAYLHAIGSVGHFHIGVYTRILLTFLLDPKTRPPNEDMRLWVDAIRWLKRYTTGRVMGFAFFTYMELTLWFLIFHLFRIERLKWMFFIMQGWGVYPSYKK